jgi:hypothetical protein
MLRGRGPLLLGVILAGMTWPHALSAQIEEASTDGQVEAVSTLPDKVKKPAPADPADPWPSPPIPPPITPPPPPMPSTQELLIDRPDQKLGWFVTGDVGIVKPHFTSSLNSGVPLTPGSQLGAGQTITLPSLNSGVSGLPVAPTFPDSSHLPMARFNWTALPDIYVGYRFGMGAGAVRLHYQGTVAQGSQVLPDYDLAGSGFLRSHLNLNVADLDYVSSEFPLNPTSWLLLREIHGFLGLRAASIFFDTTAQGQQILDQHITNESAGLGLHVGWSVRHPLRYGLSVYNRLDAAGIWAVTRQRFAETELLSDGTVLSGTANTNPLSNGLANLVIEGGLSWAPSLERRDLRFTVGYLWLRWWNVGQTDTSHADLTLQGVMLRGEWGY